MRILFLNFTRIADDSMNVTSRNISNLIHGLNKYGCTSTHCSVIVGTDEKSQQTLNEIIKKKVQFDVIVLVYSSFYFHTDTLNAILEINHRAKLCWFTTEYEISFPLGKKRDCDIVFSNIENKNCFNLFHKNYVFLDLNSLAFMGRNNLVTKKYGMIYYGRYREDRAIYFKKYLQSKDIFLSTTKKNLHKCLST